MYCKNCGNTVDDNAVVCPNCGVQVGELKTQSVVANTMAEESKPEIWTSNTVGMVGFVFSLIGALLWVISLIGVLGYIFPLLIEIVALVCSAVGWTRTRKNIHMAHPRISLAGFIVSLVFLVLTIVLWLFVAAMIINIMM